MCAKKFNWRASVSLFLQPSLVLVVLVAHYVNVFRDSIIESAIWVSLSLILANIYLLNRFSGIEPNPPFFVFSLLALVRLVSEVFLSYDYALLAFYSFLLFLLALNNSVPSVAYKFGENMGVLVALFFIIGLFLSSSNVAWIALGPLSEAFVLRESLRIFDPLPSLYRYYTLLIMVGILALLPLPRVAIYFLPLIAVLELLKLILDGWRLIAIVSLDSLFRLFASIVYWGVPLWILGM